MNISARLRLLALFVSTAMVATLVVPMSSASAASWTGKVLRVKDGDTYVIDVPRDGRPPFTVRMIGLNTPELNGGDCLGRRATRARSRLILNKRVRISAAKASSTGRGRSLRYTNLRNGKDVGKALLRRGLAVAYPSNFETARNARYIRAARFAQRKKRGIWNPRACGAGPYQRAKLRVRLRWDANGSDEKNLNGEYARIENRSSKNIRLGPGRPNGRRGWQLRDSALFRYAFKRGTVLPARGSVTVHTGSGTDRNRGRHRHFYWGRRKSVFGNSHKIMPDRGRVVGDGAYLYDGDGSLRAFMDYPCLGRACNRIRKGLLLSANYDAIGSDNDNPNGEWINVWNTTGRSIALGGLLVESYPWNWEVPRGVVLAPGRRLRLHVGKGKDEPANLKFHMGQNGGILASPGAGGDYVAVRTMEGHTLARFRWPCARCPKPDVRLSKVGPDMFTITNHGSVRVNLMDWMLQQGRAVAQLHFDQLFLAPGEQITRSLPASARYAELYTRHRVVTSRIDS